MNRRMPAGKVLNDGSTMVAAQCSMLLLAVTQFTTKFNGSELSVFDCTSMGTRGLFSAYIAAFITVWVYKFCVSRDLTIKLPKEVPAPSLRTSATSSPLAAPSSSAASSMSSCATSWAFRSPSCLSNCSPALHRCRNLSWPYPYPGSHRVLLVHRRPRPSIVQPGIDPIRLANQAENLQVLLAGGHPAHSLTFNMSLVGEFGGTGATFIVPLLLILFMKSKQLKAV
ncbi:MAG: PTS transporter subunit EIIC [Collinsella sp.]